MQIAIRAATVRDLDELSEIIAEVDALHREQLPHIFQKPQGPPRDRAYMRELLDDDLCGLFVAQATGPALGGMQGQILGFAQATIHDTPPIPILVPRRIAAVENLAVREAFRRVGIGRALMHHVQHWAEEMGATEMELTVYEFNEAAVSFYRSLGYTTSNRRMGKRLR